MRYNDNSKKRNSTSYGCRLEINGIKTNVNWVWKKTANAVDAGVNTDRSMLMGAGAVELDMHALLIETDEKQSWSWHWDWRVRIQQWPRERISVCRCVQWVRKKTAGAVDARCAEDSKMRSRLTGVGLSSLRCWKRSLQVVRDAGKDHECRCGCVGAASRRYQKISRELSFTMVLAIGTRELCWEWIAREVGVAPRIDR